MSTADVHIVYTQLKIKGCSAACITYGESKMRDYLKRIFKKKLMMHSKVLLHVGSSIFFGGWEWSFKLRQIQLC